MPNLENRNVLTSEPVQYLQCVPVDKLEKQEITIEKAMRNKRKCITTGKGLQLFVSGDFGFLFFGAFVCSLQSCLCSHPMIAVRSSKSRGKESTDSSSQLNSLQLNSEIVGTSQVDCDLGNQKKKKKKKKSDFLEESPTIPNKNPKLLFNKIYGCNAFDTCSKEGATTLMELLWHNGDYLATSANLATQPLKYKAEDERNQMS